MWRHRLIDHVFTIYSRDHERDHFHYRDNKYLVGIGLTRTLIWIRIDIQIGI